VKPSSAAVLRLLRERGPDGVTALDALAEAHSLRLAARVADLRADGFRIVSEAERTGGGKRVARYRLIERPEQLEMTL
jgi:hypothetical protein